MPLAPSGTAGSASTASSGRHLRAAGSPARSPSPRAGGGMTDWMPAAQSSAAAPTPGATVSAGAACQVGGWAVGSSSHDGMDGSHSLGAAGSSSAGQMNERSLGSQVPVVSSNGQVGAGGSGDPGSS